MQVLKNNLEELQSIAIKSAIEAGRKIMEIYQKKFEISYKNDASPLTEADQKSNEIINAFLSKTGIPIISEENKQTHYNHRKKWDTCWMVDPLDGTKEFINRNGEFTVNIALINNQKPLVGIIYVPVSKELFYGNVQTKKAYKIIVDNHFKSDEVYEKHNEISRALHPNSKQLTLVGSRSHMNSETEQFINDMETAGVKLNIVSKGSSLKFCLLAEGKADIYPRFAPTMEWDTAAGHAICNAAGIQIIDKNTNKELLYNKENLLNPSFISK